ncbi:MAG: hypothetical protein FJX77_13365, partial [Armatimonadetes bacterium]|nr:hypothetical protein [Armatimonadota bacterium]
MTFPLPRESPFHPDRPLPPALFRGQQGPLQQVQTRYAGRVARGGSAAVYLMGEPGSGKTSLAGYLQHQLQQELDLQPIYASAGRAETLEQLSAAILKATLDAEGLRVRWRDRLRTFLARFAGTQNVAGVSVHFEA